MVLVCSANGRAAQGSEACNGYNLTRHLMAALQMQATLGLLFGLAVYNNVLIEPLFPSAFYKMLILDTSEVKLPQPALTSTWLINTSISFFAKRDRVCVRALIYAYLLFFAR